MERIQLVSQRRRNFHLCLFLLCCWDAPAVAEEGFHVTPRQGPTAGCWNATVNLGNGATGVIVGILPVSSTESDVYILTAHHVFRQGISPDTPHPYSTIMVDFESSQKRDDDDSNKVALARGMDEAIEDRDHDIALVKVRVGPNQIYVPRLIDDPNQYEEKSRISWSERLQRLSKITPPLMGDCDSLKRGQRVYSFGYPDIFDRGRQKNHKPIEDPEHIRKRWSTGEYLNRNIIWRGPKTFSLMSYDNISGMSGGPVCTEDGSLIGTNSAVVAANDKYGMVYSGQAIASQCKAVAALLSKIPVVAAPTASVSSRIESDEIGAARQNSTAQ